MCAFRQFDYKDYKNCRIRLAGTYQVGNACLAIEAIEALKLEKLQKDHIFQGLFNAKWPGRFECLSKESVVFIDGAHNPDGAKSLCECVKTYFPNKKITLVMGVFKDKDYDQILEIMANVSDTLIAFTPKHPRGLASHELKKQASKYFAYVQDGETAQKSFSLAKEKTNPKDVVLIFGSLSTIADFYDIING